MPNARKAAPWLLLLLTIGGGSKLAAQRTTQPDVAGFWKMDTTKFVKRDAELVELGLRVARRGDTLVVVTEGRDVGAPPFTMTSRYLPLDAAPPVGRITWAADTMVLNAVQARPDRTLEIEERWSVDSSGQTLSRYQSVRDGTRLSRQILVFTRQP